MYDNIKCEYPLPFYKGPTDIFQTKSFADPGLDNYTITEDGKLILHEVERVEVPEEERPYYGTPEWEEGLNKLIGCQKTVPIGDKEIKFHGIINFYAYIKDPEDWFEFWAWFSHGRLEKIERMEGDVPWLPPKNGLEKAVEFAGVKKEEKDGRKKIKKGR